MSKRAAFLFGALAACAQTQRPAGIVSISVCSPTGTGGPGSCPSGSFDTHQAVFGPGGVSVNKSSLNVAPVPDEHSTVFAPGTLGNNKDYLFFLATSEAGHAGIGVAVLSGGSGPDANGRWTLDFPRTDGYGSYTDGFGQVFNPSSKGDVCPTVADGNPADQDQTFDMHYASAGSIVKDPTPVSAMQEDRSPVATTITSPSRLPHRSIPAGPGPPIEALPRSALSRFQESTRRRLPTPRWAPSATTSAWGTIAPRHLQRATDDIQ